MAGAPPAWLDSLKTWCRPVQERLKGRILSSAISISSIVGCFSSLVSLNL